MLASMLAIGSFASLLFLTLLRDAALLCAFALQAENAVRVLTYEGALAVSILAALATMVGFINARRRARIRRIDVPIAGLPQALHGFSIAQITDLHIGPTIKRDYLERVVDAVNSLEADIIAVTGDLVDGSVAELRAQLENPDLYLTADGAAAAARIGAELEAARQALDLAFAEWEAATRRMETAG